MLRSRLSFLAIAVALGAHPGPVLAAPVLVRAANSSAGGALLELQVDELVTMTPIPFRLLITEADGRPVTGARVSCDMTMPSMAMPENRPRVSERDGAYVGEMIFTCAMGVWRIDCIAEKPDGSRRVMTFDIEKVRMK